MKNNSIFRKSIPKLIEETLRKNKFQPKISDASGLPDDLTDEEIRELIEEICKDKNSKESKKC